MAKTKIATLYALQNYWTVGVSVLVEHGRTLDKIYTETSENDYCFITKWEEQLTVGLALLMWIEDLLEYYGD